MATLTEIPKPYDSTLGLHAVLGINLGLLPVFFSLLITNLSSLL